MNPKHETMIADALFYVFVDLGKQSSDPIDYYILPSKVVADCIRRCHQVWLATPGEKGQPRNDSDRRKLYLDHSFIEPITEGPIRSYRGRRMGSALVLKYFCLL